MPVRASMASLITYLRQYGNAAADEEFGGVTYWTDEQLQDILDAHGTRRLVSLTRNRLSDVKLFYIEIKRHNMLENDFSVWNDDTLVATEATYNHVTGELLFADDLSTTGTYKVEGFFVNTWEALADLWDRKASQRYDYIDWKAGNNRMDMKQEYDHCLQRRDHYRNRTIRRHGRQRGRWT